MRVLVRNYGCSANLSDGEVLAGCLSASGHILVKNETDADIIIFNSCAVKGPTENRIIDDIKKTAPEKRIIVTGCLPLISFERLLRETKIDAVIGPAIGEQIVDIVKQVAYGKKIIQLENALTAKPKLDLPHVQTNPIISIIPINYGCLGACAYCCVRHARGKLRSYNVDEIISRIKSDLTAGVKEFWLTSQDTASYGKDIGLDLVQLLESIVKVEGDYQIRVGMMTPNLVTPILKEMLKVFENQKIYKFLHLPAQSGDDQVLTKMQRLYSVEEFKKIIVAFRAKFPLLTVSTDIICGFPSETDKAHRNTLNLIKEIKPDIVNVSKFFARPKTAALSMRSEFVDRNEIKNRSTQMAFL
ncbi:MAG: tRNA (N(6)-L-threonylcarbamoyladenosine(37)-C(2))-methylthiotransferase, partial [Crenarchaeota archaeon]|nr:tRNA (N(6)-L-threonylcarbamoyladenosine(37)-C(2))-methylthiotransferase [Thermoproteota archaeon]